VRKSYEGKYNKELKSLLEPQWVSWESEVSLKKEMATHCSIFAWEIPWTEEPGGLQSMGFQKSWI